MARLDSELHIRGIIASRSKAAAAVKNGEVMVNGQTVLKPSYLCAETDEILWSGSDTVGRGSLKLMKALDEFNIDPTGMKTMDVGASTGGFTWVLLSRGADEVYAVDVGHDQLDARLRADDRVKVYEGVNARELDENVFYDFDLVTVDVSFISLTMVLESIFRCMKPQGKCVCLIKPQFECGREHLNKNGIVLNQSVHMQVIERIIAFAEDKPFQAAQLTCSPIKGGKGNIEYLVCFAPEGKPLDVKKTVQKAFLSE